MTGRTIRDLAVGDVAETTYTVTLEVVREFVEAAGDDNPIHSDPAFAAATRFRRIIAPGMLTASFVSAVIGTRLPGPGTIYLSQSLRFVRPVFVGDRVTARVEVTERLVERNRVRLETKCTNQAGEIVLEGEAWVLPSPTPIEYEGPIPDRSPGRDGRRSAEPFSHLVWGPAALPLRLASVWMEGALTLAGHGLRFWLPATPAAAESPRP
jgi:acyl dehydratase